MKTNPTSQQIREAVICLAVGISSMMFAWAAEGQDKTYNKKIEPKRSTTSQERRGRIELADREQYRIEHIYIAGNNLTRDREFRKRLLRGFTEGDIFERTALEKSLKRVSKIKAIYPVTMENVEIRLDEKERWADFTINVEERPKRQL